MLRAVRRGKGELVRSTGLLPLPYKDTLKMVVGEWVIGIQDEYSDP
jgi:hypothetical protein